MKNFKNFELNAKQTLNVIGGKGKPDFAGSKGKPDFSGSKGKPAFAVMPDMTDIEEAIEEVMDMIDPVLVEEVVAVIETIEL